jgi:DNA-binding LacI/PurR family transcriptional regulator
MRKEGEPGHENATPTVKEVAKLADVSTATVSRVLSGAGGVRKELARRVQNAAQKLNYQPNPSARNLRIRSTRTVGMVFPDIQNPFYASVISGAEDVLQSAGYSLLLANYGEDPQREQTQLATLRAEHVAGILFAASCQPSADYKALLSAGIALVAVSRIPDGLSVDLATVSNQTGARQAIEHLIDLGHQRIGLVDGPVSLSTTRERQEGYAQALRRAGLPVSRDLIINSDFFDRPAGFGATLKLLNSPKKPTAIIAVSNNMVLGAIEAVRGRGLEVAKDIAIVGFGDTPSAEFLEPPLTVVTQPALEIGATGARLLLERLQDPNRSRRSIVLDTQLIVRESCGSKLSSRQTYAAQERKARGSTVSSNDERTR